MNRNDIISVAESQIGVVEEPAGSNRQKYGEWIGLNGYAWCAMFVSWVFDHAGAPLGKIDREKGYVGCQSAYNFWKAAGQLTITPQPGDIVLFDWNKDGKHDHTGIFKRDLGNGYFESIEGNTAVGDDSNGGKVMLRKRAYSVAKFVDVTKYLKD